MVFIAHALADESLPENFNWHSSNGLCWRTFLFIWIERFNFLSWNFKITLSLFFSRWNACKSSGVTSCSVREKAAHTVSARTLSPMSRGTRLSLEISSGDTWRCWQHFVLTGLFVGVEEYYNSLLLTNQTLTPHVWQRKYQICHIKLLIDSWCKIGEVAPQSILL